MGETTILFFKVTSRSCSGVKRSTSLSVLVRMWPAPGCSLAILPQGLTKEMLRAGTFFCGYSIAWVCLSVYP